MTRVAEVSGGVTVTLKGRRAVGKFSSGAALLIVLLLGGARAGSAQSASEQAESDVTQPGGTVTINLGQTATVSSVRIGNVDAALLSPPAGVDKIDVKVAKNMPPGKQGVTVTLADGKSALITFVKIAPLISGLKANEQAAVESSRGAVAGGETIVQFGDEIPPEIKLGLSVKIGDAPAHIVDTQKDHLVVHVPDEIEAGSYPVSVLLDGKLLAKQPTLRVTRVISMYWRASLMLAALVAFIYLLYRLFYKMPAGQTRYSFLTMLLLEQENMTYSLSRAQFIGWLTVIIWSYLFLYYARGFVEGIWAFPNLGNAVYTFLISLGTLVVAQASSLGQGAKGAGEVHPSPADLVVHGGVLALDRVQQVIWTILALGMFLRITVSTYNMATALPEIPQELLVLMGLSSAGYLGGKLVRGGGPIIEQVTVREGSVILNIKGKRLSKDCFVWLDGVKLPKDNVHVIADDPDGPKEFARELEVTLEISLDDWRSKDHAITIINGDAQRADWRTGPGIVEVKPDEPVGEDKVKLIIKGARLVKGATSFEISGAPGAGDSPVRINDDPNLLTVEVGKDWPSKPHDITVTSGGQKSLFTYKPSDQPGGQTGGGTGSDQAGGGEKGGGQTGSGQTTDSAQSQAGNKVTDNT